MKTKKQFVKEFITQCREENKTIDTFNNDEYNYGDEIEGLHELDVFMSRNIDLKDITGEDTYFIYEVTNNNDNIVKLEMPCNYYNKVIEIYPLDYDTLEELADYIYTKTKELLK